MQIGLIPFQHVLSNAGTTPTPPSSWSRSSASSARTEPTSPRSTSRTRLTPRRSLPYALSVHRSRALRSRSRSRTQWRRSSLGTRNRRTRHWRAPTQGFAVAAGVSSVDHAYQLSEATMKAMRDKEIYAVPTFAIMEYFADHAATPQQAARQHAEQAYHAAEFRKQMAAGVPFAGKKGSDVGPFPHGTQTRGVGADGRVWYEARRRTLRRPDPRSPSTRLGRTDRRAQAHLLRRHHRSPIESPR